MKLDDQTLREWDAIVVAAGPDGIVLDRSAFYPGRRRAATGPRRADLGRRVQTRIVDARKDDGELLLVPLDGDPLPVVGTTVRGAVEDDRRTALMRTHSGLHVPLRGGVPRLWRPRHRREHGGAVGADGLQHGGGAAGVQGVGERRRATPSCGIDRKIAVRSLPRPEAFEIPDIIRTATNLVPDDVKDVRIVDIVGLDQQADGGTHVASTAAVGADTVVKVENKGKGFRRIRIAIGD